MKFACKENQSKTFTFDSVLHNKVTWGEHPNFVDWDITDYVERGSHVKFTITSKGNNIMYTIKSSKGEVYVYDSDGNQLDQYIAVPGDSGVSGNSETLSQSSDKHFRISKHLELVYNDSTGYVTIEDSKDSTTTVMNLVSETKVGTSKKKVYEYDDELLITDKGVYKWNNVQMLELF